MVEQEFACVDWDSQTQQIQKAARRQGMGYLRISMDMASSYLIVSEPGLMNMSEPVSISAAMSEALRQSATLGIKRLSFNTYWKPPDKDARYHTFPTYKDDKDRVKQAIIEAGFQEGQPLDCDVYEAEDRIREALQDRVGWGF